MLVHVAIAESGPYLVHGVLVLHIPEVDRRPDVVERFVSLVAVRVERLSHHGLDLRAGR